MDLNKFQTEFKNTIIKNDPNTIRVNQDQWNKDELFYVYYNNFLGGLRQVLKDQYPHTESLLGKDMFNELISYYIHLCPPRVPYLCEYGSEFPEFLEVYVERHVYYLSLLEKLLQQCLRSQFKQDFLFESPYDMKNLWFSGQVISYSQARSYRIHRKGTKSFFDEI